MRRRTIVIAGAALATTLALTGGGLALAAGGDGEGSVTGPDAERAVVAALEATGGGTANAVERDSEDGATWEVEVGKPDGTTVDVRLDAAFGVMKVEADDDQPSDGAR
jgi:hypothetical protein